MNPDCHIDNMFSVTGSALVSLVSPEQEKSVQGLIFGI